MLRPRVGVRSARRRSSVRCVRESIATGSSALICGSRTGTDVRRAEAARSRHTAQDDQRVACDRRPIAFTGRFADDRSATSNGGSTALVERSCRNRDPRVGRPRRADRGAAAGYPSVNARFRPADTGAGAAAGGRGGRPLWRAAGLEPDEFAGAYRCAYVDDLPAVVPCRAAAGAERARIVVRPAEAVGGDGARRDRPLVYATLGTAFNDLATFQVLLDAFDGLDCDVIMTIGRNLSPRRPRPGAGERDRRTSTSLRPRSSSAATPSSPTPARDRCSRHSPTAGLSSCFLAVLTSSRMRPLCRPRGSGGASCRQSSRSSSGSGRTGRVLSEPSYTSGSQIIAAEIAAMPSAACRR